MIEACTISATEGDVETQVVLPLLHSDTFLFIPKEATKSKQYLAPRDIDKGSTKKLAITPISLSILSLYQSASLRQNRLPIARKMLTKRDAFMLTN